jgi:hypothetical protein
VKVLINAFGVQDSGGITVFNHLLNEIKNTPHKFLIVCNDNKLINRLRSL